MPETRIKFTIKPDGSYQEEVIGVTGHACTRITQPIEEAVGEVTNRKYLSAFYVTDSNPQEKMIELMEEEDWRGCCSTFGCAL